MTILSPMDEPTTTPLPDAYERFANEVHGRWAFDVTGLLSALLHERPANREASTPLSDAFLLLNEQNPSPGYLYGWGKVLPPEAPPILAVSLGIQRLAASLEVQGDKPFKELLAALRRVLVDHDAEVSRLRRRRDDVETAGKALAKYDPNLKLPSHLAARMDFAEVLEELGEAIEEIGPVHQTGRIGRTERIELAELEYGLRMWGQYPDREVAEWIVDGGKAELAVQRIRRRRGWLLKREPELKNWGKTCR